MKIEYYDFRQPYPGKWKETTVFEIVDFFLKMIKNDEWIYDCDNCGTTHYDFVVKPINKVVRIHHDWYWENWHDVQERYVDNSFTFEILSLNEITKKYPKENRDWLKI